MDTQIVKIELTTNGVLIFRNADGEVVMTETNDLQARLYQAEQGAGFEGVRIIRGDKQVVILTASNITALQINPNPETPVSYTAQQH
jgi:hypothetical protein